jgi:acyl-CoA hydrolase
MEIEVVVQGEDATSGRQWPCVAARLTFVAIDQDRKPTPIPALALDNEEVKASQAAGEARREARIAGRK